MALVVYFLSVATEEDPSLCRPAHILLRHAESSVMALGLFNIVKYSKGKM
jgi:hypothetical protein